MSDSQRSNDLGRADSNSAARKAAASLVGLLRERRAYVSFRYERRYMITPEERDDPMIFITIDSEGTPLPNDAIVVTAEGEFSLTPEEMDAVADGIIDAESDA